MRSNRKAPCLRVKMEKTKRSAGLNQSEQYLASLADKTFLNLWSYPNLWKSPGQELCDLLVVCGEYVVIFSDKHTSFTPAALTISWPRWCNKALKKSKNQVTEAARWIKKHPDRIFLDAACTKQFHLELPPEASRKVILITVANGAAESCRQHFKSGSGSLMIRPDLKGFEHHLNGEFLPFVIGDINPHGEYVHVLDEVSLKIVMEELDTVSDFAMYFIKKANFIRSGRLFAATGEEDLLAYYLEHVNSNGEHDFLPPNNTRWRDETLFIDESFYTGMVSHPNYIARKQAEKSSYIWDALIKSFTDNILAGTMVPQDQILPIEGQSAYTVADHEMTVRYLNMMPRSRRRVYGQALIDALERGAQNDRFFRAALPGPSEQDKETAFYFLIMAHPKSELKISYDQYRKVRANMLYIYGMALFKTHLNLNRVVGIATEPPSTLTGKKGSSEDVILLERGEWTKEFEHEIEHEMDRLGIMKNLSSFDTTGFDFIPPLRRKIDTATRPDSFNQQQRRVLQARLRRRKK